MNFQITLLNYKLDFQNKNMSFFKLKKIFIARAKHVASSFLIMLLKKKKQRNKMNKQEPQQKPYGLRWFGSPNHK